jgi:hypothetical protein
MRRARAVAAESSRCAAVRELIDRLLENDVGLLVDRVFVTPWGEARSIRYSEMRALQRRVSRGEPVMLHKAVLCVLYRDWEEAQGVEPGEAMRRAVEKIELDSAHDALRRMLDA